MTRVLAGPFATMILSDLGAEVIKVERPGGGDDTRAWGPPFLEGKEGRESAYFLSVNRNKQSICVDMKSKKGNQILQQPPRTLIKLIRLSSANSNFFNCCRGV